MNTYVLVMGNKNYSSWSIRPWIAMKVTGIEFDEIIIPLRQPDTKERIQKHSPAGKVPILIDGDVVMWESISILAYLTEKHPQAQLLPADPVARARARCVAAEMHSGYAALRSEAPCNMRRAPKTRELGPAAMADVARIEQLWAQCREQHGQDGPFLFGKFSVADAMFAPVVNRFHIYKIPVSKQSKAYMNAIMDLPAWKELEADARAEPWTIADSELD